MNAILIFVSRVQGLEFRVWCLASRVRGSESGFWSSGFGFRGLGVSVSGFRFKVFGSRVQGLVFGVQYAWGLERVRGQCFGGG